MEIEDSRQSPTSIRQGSILEIEGGFYIVAKVSTSRYQLICLEDGDRWDDNVDCLSGLLDRVLDDEGQVRHVNAKLVIK